MNFDLNYTFGNSKEKNKIYNAKLTTKELDELFEKRTIICKSLAYMIQRILEEFDIKSFVERNSYDESDKHVYNIVNLKDGRKLKIDLEEDLEFVQTASKTRHFCLLEKDEFNEYQETDTLDEELKRIDKTTAEYIPWKFYFDDMLKILRLGTRGMSTEEKLRNVLDNLDVYVRDREIGYRDRIYYHNRMLQEVFTEKELNKVRQINCYRKVDEEKQFVSCVVLDRKAKEGENVIYLYSEETGKYEEITLEQLAIEVKNGLVMLESIQGLRKYLNNNTIKCEAKARNVNTINNVLHSLPEEVTSIKNLPIFYPNTDDETDGRD